VPATGATSVEGDALITYADTDAEHFDSHVVVLNSKTLRARCSGVVIGPTTLLTANHCVDGDEPRPPLAYLPPGAGTGEIGRVIRRDAARDLAWVQMRSEAPSVALGPSASAGEAVTIERPLRGGARVGTVRAQSGTFLRLGIAADHGDSGSPVFNAADELVGLMSWCERDEASSDPQACNPFGGSTASALTSEDAKP
jgi:S1-C subfamily serine protease